MTYYHLTPSNKAETILEEGIKPMRGSRASRVSPDISDAIFATPSIEDSKKLVEQNYWSSHPEFKTHGQTLLEFQTEEIGMEDSQAKFCNAIYLRKHVPSKNVRIHSIMDEKGYICN